MAITKLEHLTQYMIEHIKGAVLDNKIDAWQENASIEVNGEDRGNGGYIIADWRYRAVISVEAFPHGQMDARNILALVACWLSDYDSDRKDHDLADPEMAIDVIDWQTADLAIELEMLEQVEMVPDENGLISYRGKQYHVQPVDIWTATEAEITNASND